MADAKPAFRRGDQWRAVPAKFEGDCPECSFSIAIGDLVVPRSAADERPVWIHQRCQPK